MPSTRKKTTTHRSKKKRLHKKPAKEVAASYNAFKEYNGRQYSGMKIGRSHKWNYDKGVWKETKITPDLWEISYAVKKRRAGKAPKGSGAAVGTGYHWYIIAHQQVTKLNANDYDTAMTGLKCKLAHKRAAGNKWNVAAATRRKNLVKFLKEILAQLEKDPIALSFEYNGVRYKGEAVPVPQTCLDGGCSELDIILNNEPLGIIRYRKSGWKMDLVQDQHLVKAIGEAISYEQGIQHR